MSINPELLAILVCPRCKGKLVYSEEKSCLDCVPCSLRYPVTDGVPVMIVEEAGKLEG